LSGWWSLRVVNRVKTALVSSFSGTILNMNNFEQKFKNIDNILHKDAGSATALDYIEQSSWILFLKYIDELEEKNLLNLN
jgi:hypothetical protein